jgi:hypothetical protein
MVLGTGGIFMNEPSEEKLINFLKEHQPTPPPASMDLERSLFDALEKEPKASTASSSKRQNVVPFLNWRAALVACGLLIGVGLGWNSYNLSQRDAVETEVAEIIDQTDSLSLYAIDSDTGLYDVKL